MQTGAFCLHSLWGETQRHKTQHVDLAYIGLWPALINIKHIAGRFKVTPLLPFLFLSVATCICMLQTWRERRASLFLQVLILRVYLSRAVMMWSRDHTNHPQQLRLINHSFTGREGGTEHVERNQDNDKRERAPQINSPIF